VRVRRGVASLLAVVRAEPGLDGSLLRAGGDLALPPEVRGRLRPPAAPALRERGARGRVGRGPPPLAESRRHAVRSRPASSSSRRARSASPCSRPPRLESFEGRTFHSARWDHAFDLEGRRGGRDRDGRLRGAVHPEIQPKVAKLLLFQRTPAWVLPRPDGKIERGSAWLFRRFPFRAAPGPPGHLSPARDGRPALPAPLAHAARPAPGPAPPAEGGRRSRLRARLTPSYTMGCKRVLLSNTYYPALTRPNVAVLTTGIREVRARSIVDGEGLEHASTPSSWAPASGPRTRRCPRRARPRGPHAARGLGGQPRGAPRHHRQRLPEPVPAARSQHRRRPHVGRLHDRGADRAPRGRPAFHARAGCRRGRAAPEAQGEYVSSLYRRTEGTVWVAGGCRSWYLDRTGRSSASGRTSRGAIRRRVARFRPREYVTLGQENA
jgi:hypothetical protein